MCVHEYTPTKDTLTLICLMHEPELLLWFKEMDLNRMKDGFKNCSLIC
jgi:hypothetical protein